jgi:uncharacterized membrane protein
VLDVKRESVISSWRPAHWLALGFIVLVALAFVLAPWPPLDKLRAIGFTICPQRPAHSLFVDGVQLPVEARKVGIFLGFLGGLLYVLALGRGRAVQLPPGPILATLLGFVVLMGADSVNALCYDLQLPHLYTPSNTVRLATGLLNGLAVVAIALPVVNLSLWRESLERASLESWRELLVALVVPAVLFAVILSGAPALLYPLSALCIVGALTLLGAINTLFLAGVIRWPGRVDASLDLLPIAAIALLLCAVELAAMGAFRLALVGTAPL